MSSKRKRSLHSRRQRKRPRHNYQTETKEAILSVVGDRREKKDENKLSVDDYVSMAPTPSRRTLFRWVKEKNNPPQDSSPKNPRGRPPLLSLAERHVLGGWVLSRAERHKTTSGNDVLYWVKKQFGVTATKMWVSNTMKALQISSHSVRGRATKYNNPNLLNELYHFITTTNQTIQRRYSPSQVLAIDNMRWTTPPFRLRTYSAEGG